MVTDTGVPLPVTRDAVAKKVTCARLPSFTGADRRRTRKSVSAGNLSLVRNGTSAVSKSTRKPSEPTPVADHPVVNQS